MTERMTPSEVATALDSQHKYDKANYPPANPLFARAAATIRELEAQSKFPTWTKDAEPLLAKIGEQAVEIYDLRAKLKIATEALEVARLPACRTTSRRIINEALARIKEVGA